MNDMMQFSIETGKLSVENNYVCMSKNNKPMTVQLNMFKSEVDGDVLACIFKETDKLPDATILDGAMWSALDFLLLFNTIAPSHFVIVETRELH